VRPAGDINKSGPKMSLVTHAPDLAESLIELSGCTQPLLDRSGEHQARKARPRLPSCRVNDRAGIFGPSETAIPRPTCLAEPPRFMDNDPWKLGNFRTARDEQVYLLGLRCEGSETG